MDLDFHCFKSRVERAPLNGCRRGQHAANALVRERPDLSKQVTGTEIDPYYKDSVLESFWIWVHDNWGQPAQPESDPWKRVHCWMALTKSGRLRKLYKLNGKFDCEIVDSGNGYWRPQGLTDPTTIKGYEKEISPSGEAVEKRGYQLISCSGEWFRSPEDFVKMYTVYLKDPVVEMFEMDL